jgi:hypothetical protein
MKLSDYTIIEVSSRQEWKAFYAFPERIYSAYPRLVPIPSYEVRRLLDENRNPYFETCTLHPLLCLRDGIPVARMTLHIPLPNTGSPAATFGFFECVRDDIACSSLLEHAEKLCKHYGMKTLEGPYNPSNRGISGIQINGFEYPTVFTEACNPRYYPELFSNCGYREVVHGNTWKSDDMDKFQKGASRNHDNDRYRVWHPKKRQLAKAFRDLNDIVDSAFESTWRNQPGSSASELYVAAGFLDAWMDDAIAIVYDGALPVGAVICIPDINPMIKQYESSLSFLRRHAVRKSLRSLKGLVFYAMGMREGYRNSPAGYLLAQAYMNTASRFDTVNSSWITEGNIPSEKMARRFGLEPWKKFAIYGADLCSSSINLTTFHHMDKGEGYETPR